MAQGSFSDSNFVKKLAELNPSQERIQTLSFWLIHHRKHAKNIVKLWLRETKKVKPSRKLMLLYLANDVIQNSKKKGPEFNKEFRTVLPDAFRHTARETDEKTRGSMSRLINIWKERGVFDAEFAGSLKKGMEKGASTPAKVKPEIKPDVKPDVKPIKEEDSGKDSYPVSAPTTTTTIPPTTSTPIKTEKTEKTESQTPAKKKRKTELSLKEEIEQEFANGPGEPPEAEKLVQSLHDLENSASSDAAVRERIAALPPEVSDVNLLAKITDKSQAAELAKSVDDACTLLTDYNGRLASELAERKQVGRMLRDFITSQKKSLSDAENKLQEHKSKLEQVDVVRKELKSHIQSLPDMSLLPDVSMGLAPLPSAGDLFNIDAALGID